MKFRSISKALSIVLSLSMLMPSAVSYAATGENVVSVESYVNDELMDTVFVGETVKTVVSLENIGTYTAYDLGLMYNEQVIQLKPLADLTTLSKVYDFESDDVGISVGTYGTSVLQKVLSYAAPNIGAILSARRKKKDPAVSEKTELLSMEFKAKAVGTSGFRYASSAEDQMEIFLETGQQMDGSKDQCFFPPTAELDKRIHNFTVIEKPDAPTDVAWGAEGTPSEYTVSWTAPATGDRGYILNVYLDDALIEQIDVEETNKNLLEIIKENELGTYKVNVVAKGGDNNSVPSNDATKVVTEIPLVLGDITFDEDTKILSWPFVENADEYTITIEKDGVSTPIKTISDPSVLSEVLSDNIGVGDYEISLTASSNSLLYGSATKTVTYSSGSTITGNIKPIVHSSASFVPNSTHETKVTLTSSDGTKTYTAICDVDGNFSIERVPADATGYTVKIQRTSSIERAIADKLILTKSVEKNICAEGKSISLYVGDLEQVMSRSNINSWDLDEITPCLGTMPGDSAYKVEADMVQEGTIELEDLMVIIFNYYKGNMHYSLLTDEYDFN